eukprot:13464188-Alexandrium_andersonii.AAC.1
MSRPAATVAPGRPTAPCRQWEVPPRGVAMLRFDDEQRSVAALCGSSASPGGADVFEGCPG